MAIHSELEWSRSESALNQRSEYHTLTSEVLSLFHVLNYINVQKRKNIGVTEKTHIHSARTKLVRRNDGKDDGIDIVGAKVNVILAFEDIVRSVERLENTSTWSVEESPLPIWKHTCR